MVGPFYLDEKIKKIFNENNSKKELKEIYLDINCLSIKEKFDINNKKDLIHYIEAILKIKKTCFRCGSLYATQKCNSCSKYFHANLCLEQLTEIYNEERFCLDCYKKKISEKIDHRVKFSKKIRYNLYPKNYFLQNKIYNSQYYPQLSEEVYFILHAYLNFLKSHKEYILFELDNTIFF